MAVRNEVVVDLRVCTGCGVCVDVCPTDVLRLEPNAQKAVVVYPEDCQACFLCVLDCPYDGAVAVHVHLSDDARAELARGQHYVAQD